MALKLEKNAEKKPTGGMVLEDGLYRVILTSNEDKEDEKEGSKRLGYQFHNLKFTFENNKSLFARIYYMNQEGDIVPEGYNFILGLKKILIQALGDERLIEKVENADSNQIINRLIKDKVGFYIATRKGIYNGSDITNINTFIDPIATLREAEELADKRKLQVITLAANENSNDDVQEIEDDEDDL